MVYFGCSTTNTVKPPYPNNLTQLRKTLSKKRSVLFLYPDLDASAGIEKVFTLPGAFQFSLMRKGWYICRSKQRNNHRVEVVTDYNMATYYFQRRCSFSLRPLGPKENPLMNCYGTIQPTRPPGIPEASTTPLQTIKTTSTTRPTTLPTTHRPEG